MRRIFCALLTFSSVTAFATDFSINCKSTKPVVGNSFVKVKADIKEDYKLSNVVISVGGVSASAKDFQDSFGPRDLSIGAYTTYTDPNRLLRFALYLPAYKSSYENRTFLEAQVDSEDFNRTMECEISKY